MCCTYCEYREVQILPNFHLKIKKKILEKRAKCRNEKDLIPDATPPKTFRTVDNIEWKFLKTISDYGKLDKFRHKNRCKTNCCARDSWRRIRYNCNNKLYSKCQFMLLALKTTKQGYHVYKHGKHNHHPIKPNYTSK
jgi:hypothetical protein